LLNKVLTRDWRRETWEEGLRERHRIPNVQGERDGGRIERREMKTDREKK
jgi:hypothetical protein